MEGGKNMNKYFFSPDENCENYIYIGQKKTNLPIIHMILLGILAGIFIAFAAEASNVAIHTISSAGIAKVLAGAIFTAGLMMVIIAGAELFTGNSLIIISCLSGKSQWKKLLKNWLFVYIGNFIGAMIIVLFVHETGQYNITNGMLGGFTIKTALGKTSLTFKNAFFSGILCNMLVCTAVWMASSAKDIAGKVLGIFFPIWLFVISGFEHSIANMYYIPAGIIAKSNPVWYNAAVKMGISAEKLSSLNWGSFLVNNLIPVTLGNIVGGCIFIGCIYWYCYLYKPNKTSISNTTSI